MSKGTINTYIVGHETETGAAIEKYFERCSSCEQAARDFISRLHDDYGYLDVSDDTEYIGHVNFNMLPDVEAGGVTMIMAPDDKQTPDTRLWRKLSTEEGETFYMPRILRERKYVPVTKVRKIEKSETAISWRFNRDEHGSLVTVTYEKIGRTLTPEQKASIRSMIGKPIIPPQLKLAMAYHYTSEFDDIIPEDADENLRNEMIKGMNFNNDIILQAIRLRDEMESLPVVPNGTLAKVLSLSLPSGIKSRDVYLDYRLMDNGGMMVSTNLVSGSQDLILQ